jgi:hypothetical protein
MEKIKFSIDGATDVPVYEAIDAHPQRWNGWLVPIVTFETAMQIADDLFDPSLNENQPHNDIWDCIVHNDIWDCIVEAKENHEDRVEVGCGICWLETRENQ